MTKLGDWFLASEPSRYLPKNSMFSLAANLGNCRSETSNKLDLGLLYVMEAHSHDPKFSADTDLWTASNFNAGIGDG